MIASGGAHSRRTYIAKKQYIERNRHGSGKIKSDMG